MAKVDIRLGISLISVFDGSPDNLDTFVDAVNFFVDHVDNENSEALPAIKTAAQNLVFKFIKTRLTGKAHQIALNSTTLPNLLSSLKEQCASKVTSDALLSKLKNIRKKASLESFCSEVEDITTLLANMYIKETIPKEKANQMAFKSGVETLVVGVENPDTKLIFKAGSFTQITQAVQKVLENGSSTPHHNEQNIFYSVRNRRVNRDNYRGNQSTPFYRSRYEQPNWVRQNNRQNSRQFDNNNNRRYNFIRGNSNQIRGNFRNNLTRRNSQFILNPSSTRNNRIMSTNTSTNETNNFLEQTERQSSP